MWRRWPKLAKSSTGEIMIEAANADALAAGEGVGHLRHAEAAIALADQEFHRAWRPFFSIHLRITTASALASPSTEKKLRRTVSPLATMWL